MTFALELSTAAASEVMSAAEAKRHMRVIADDDDAYIDTIISAATKYTEDTLGSSLITQTWKMYMDCFPGMIELPRGPVQAVSSIEYIDTNGDTQTLAASKYTVDLKSQRPRITPSYNESWPSTRGIVNSVTVTFISGYGDTCDAVPVQIVQAIKMLTAHLYENRESTSPVAVNVVPMGYNFLISPYTQPRF